ncbi:hypothetical protein Asp14428_75120 [Actinoplanes sp. NBRC 14428]|nr:hypothetical protein Asp14428_75120 [Actinoplanes sp. NBRC 14428]
MYRLRVTAMTARASGRLACKTGQDTGEKRRIARRALTLLTGARVIGTTVVTDARADSAALDAIRARSCEILTV